MEFSLFSNKNRAINIIITDSSIRYIELKGTNIQSVHKWGEHILPEGIVREGKIIDKVTLSMILEECLGNWKIKRRNVKFLIPDPLVIIRKIKIPRDIKDDEIKGYLYLELGTSIHLPFEEPVFDTYQLSEDLDSKEILLFAAPEQQVMEYSNLLSELKLKPLAAEISPLSLYRLYHELELESNSDNLMIVQFDIDRVNICIFENQAPIFMHYLPLEFNRENWDIRRISSRKNEFQFTSDINILDSQLEDYYKEISKMMDFYRYSIHQGSQSITKILLNGDHPLLDHIYKEMQTRFEVSVQSLSSRELSVGKNGQVPNTHFLALGLALKEV